MKHLIFTLFSFITLLGVGSVALGLRRPAPHYYTPIAVTGQWLKNARPVLIADQPYEDGVVSEPDVHYERGLYKMWYTAGWEHSVIAYAESMDGVSWTKHGPVLSFEPGVAHFSVLIYRGTYYLFFSDIRRPGAKEYVAVSQDGKHFSTPEEVLLPGEWDVTLANTNVWVEDNIWYMIYEGRMPNEGAWRMALAISTDATHWHKLGKLQGTDFGGSAGGPWVQKQGDIYTMFYHASPSAQQYTLPTDLFRSTSMDLIHWTKPVPILTRTLPWEVDQVADPALVGDKLYYSGMDNVGITGFIGLAFDHSVIFQLGVSNV